jgi:DNA-binding IclR family transcriptional regulator
MTGRGWLETDGTGTLYSLGIRSLLISSAYLDGDLVVAKTGPLLDELAQATGETVHLGRLEGSDVVYLAKRESVHQLRMFSAVGRRLPAYATALGRAMLAQRTDEQVLAILPPSLTQITIHTTTSPRQVLRIIEAVRRDGYAVEQQESCLGVGCFAVSLPFSTPARDAISIAVPLARLDNDLREYIVDRLVSLRRKASLAQEME